LFTEFNIECSFVFKYLLELSMQTCRSVRLTFQMYLYCISIS